MKEKPIFFSEEMVLAVLAGRKTQTRRPVKFKFRDGQGDTSTLQVGNYCTGHPRSGFVLRGGAGGCWKDVTHPLQCPYGNKGDRLWVRETWSDVNYEGAEAIAYRADSEVKLLANDSTFLDDAGVFNPTTSGWQSCISATGIKILLPVPKAAGDHQSTCRVGPPVSSWKLLTFESSGSSMSRGRGLLRRVTPWSARNGLTSTIPSFGSRSFGDRFTAKNHGIQTRGCGLSSSSK